MVLGSKRRWVQTTWSHTGTWVRGDWSKMASACLAARGRGPSPTTLAGPGVPLLHITPQTWVQRAPSARPGDGVCVSVPVCVLLHEHGHHAVHCTPSSAVTLQPLNCQRWNKSSRPHWECKIAPEFQSSCERKEFASHRIQERLRLPRDFHKQLMKN